MSNWKDCCVFTSPSLLEEGNGIPGSKLCDYSNTHSYSNASVNADAQTLSSCYEMFPYCCPVHNSALCPPHHYYCMHSSLLYPSYYICVHNAVCALIIVLCTMQHCALIIVLCTMQHCALIIIITVQSLSQK